MKYLFIVLFLFFFSYTSHLPLPNPWDFDAQLQAYFAAETQKLNESTKAELAELGDWEAYRQKARQELQDMLGLLPFPERSPLKAVVTSRVEHDEFTVENIHFQSMPGLYVSGNLYIPKDVKTDLPAILYVCGHASVEKDGYNYGSKVHYQHHPAWFARHGYVCLILDTVQLGEIEGLHHGLYRYDRWWWLSRGYTPAGVETWNGMRAIDYLSSRPEVDENRIGVTGRSGGGGTSWWVAALDDRVKVAVPVAGITDLEDHVVNGCVEGHCDCMYIANTYHWDYAKVAALIAPRPLLLSNTDRDPIFPIEGVFRIYQQVRGVYEQLEAGDQFALHTTAGPHQDVQELRIHAFRWFDQHLYDRDDLIEKPARKFFTPEQLRVFEQLPADATNERIDGLFTPLAPSIHQVLETTSKEKAIASWYNDLQNKVFSCWPATTKLPSLEMLEEKKGPSVNLTTYGLQTDEHTYLPVFRLQNKKGKKENKKRIMVLDDQNWPFWRERLASLSPGSYFWQDLRVDGITPTQTFMDIFSEADDIYLVSMRGAGPAQFSVDEKELTHIRRRYYLLGQTLHTMQTWDVLQALHSLADPKNTTISLSADGNTAGILLYASLFFPEPLQLDLNNVPKSHTQGPYYLGIMKYLDIPAALLMAGEKHEIK